MAFYKCVGEQPTGNADPSDVLAGRTFSTETGAGKVGTMPNRGNWSATLSATSPSVTIPTGYHNGSGTVSVRLQEKTAVLYNTPSQVDADPGYALSRVYVPAASGRLQQKTVNPNTAGFDVTPDDNYLGLSKVHVNPQVHDLVVAFPTNSGYELDLGANHRTRYINASNYRDYMYADGRIDGIVGSHISFCARYTKSTESKTSDERIHLDNIGANWGSVTIITMSYNGYCYAPEVRAQRQDGAYRIWPEEYTFQNYMHLSSSDSNAAQVWITSVRGTGSKNGSAASYNDNLRVYLRQYDGDWPDQVYVLAFRNDDTPIIIEDP